MVLARLLAGDQDSGHRPVAGQPLAGLGVRRSGPAGRTPRMLPGGREAVQVHGDGQLGRTRPMGAAAALKGPAGQLGQGISPALATATRCRRWGVGQRLQAASGLWPASGSHSPSTATMASQVGPATPPASLPRLVGGVGAVGSATSWRWPRTRRSRGGSSRRAGRHQHRLGLGGEVLGEGLGAVGEHPGMGGNSPLVRVWAVAANGPRNRARAVRTALLAAPAPSPDPPCQVPPWGSNRPRPTGPGTCMGQKDPGPSWEGHGPAGSGRTDVHR